MTLEEIYSEFDAAREDEADRYAPYMLDPASTEYKVGQRYASAIFNAEPDDVQGLIAQFWVSAESEMAKTARRYIIARDFNVFDDRWEMMWKLQYQ